MHDYLVPPEDVSGHRPDHGAVEDRVRRDRRRCASSGTRCSRSASTTTSASIRQRDRASGSRTSSSTCSRPSTTSAIFDQNVVSYLELLRVPYTGCNPRGLMLARDKSLSKKLLAYHRIPVPEFAVVPHAAARCGVPKRLGVPADREVADAGGVDRHLAGVGRRRRREAARARRVHPREHRHRRHRRALHRGPRALRRHPRQRSACRSSRSGSCSSPRCRRRSCTASPPSG